jgi:putative ABC transport system ATP-binding protein
LSAIIQVNDLHKTFHISGGDDIDVLKGIDFKVDAGEFIAIMGASGSGKSTLLNILSSIEVPSKGSVIIDETDLSKADEATLVQTRRFSSSIIYQDFNLLPYLTASENVMFPMLLAGRNESSAKERAFDLLKRVNLADQAKQRPDDLSGGQNQRVAIARALANNPKIILADEPTGNLDSKTGDIIIHLFRELVNEGLTIIMVTHDIQLSKKTDKILILKDGILHREEDVMEEI